MVSFQTLVSSGPITAKASASRSYRGVTATGAPSTAWPASGLSSGPSASHHSVRHGRVYVCDGHDPRVGALTDEVADALVGPGEHRGAYALPEARGAQHHVVLGVAHHLEAEPNRGVGRD